MLKMKLDDLLYFHSDYQIKGIRRTLKKLDKQLTINFVKNKN